jgi:hypothetical protein
LTVPVFAGSEQPEKINARNRTERKQVDSSSEVGLDIISF